jgi:hypothetical protein
MVCFLIESKDKIVGCKWDTLTKHANRGIAMWDLLSLGVKKGGTYIIKDCANLKNEIVCLKGSRVNFDPSKQTCEGR